MPFSLPKLNTFRARLIFYIALLTIFLATTLVISLQYTRSIMLEGALNQISSTTALLDRQLLIENNELQRYTNIIRDELRIQKIMRETNTGKIGKKLNNLFNDQFGWLPVDSYLLVDSKGAFLSGRGPDKLLSIIDYEKPSKAQTHYLKTPRGVELIAHSPVYFKQQLLGHILLSRIYNISKLRMFEEQTKGHLFVVKDNTIILSTMSSAMKKQIPTGADSLVINQNNYALQPIMLNRDAHQGVLFYYAVSDTDFLNTIQNYTQLTSFILLFGVSGVLLLGVFFLKDFDKPLISLLAATREVAEGHLPIITKRIPRNEVDQLSNQFSDMVTSLREKQNVIDESQHKLERLTITNVLTGLYNRRYLQEIFPKLLAQAARDKSPISAIMIDLDYFKRINDKHGHLAGDLVLVEFSALMRSHSRANDYLFRLGGEEFLILTLSENAAGTLALAEKIRKAAESTPVTFEGESIPYTLSCGISIIYPTEHEPNALNTLLSFSDKSLYVAKQAGRNRTHLYNNDASYRDTKSVHY